ncbi:MAG TPA: MBL fold metallo-hydrolase [Candidatus Omnitrophota bacterium]|nr:MBL fold metallo-hydrolase [Candidatus Omnitrophota bacterium]
MDSASVYLRQLAIGPMENFAYLVGDLSTKECFAVDPAWDVSAILDAAEKDGMRITGVLATHAHYDHLNAAAELLRETGGKIYIHEEEIEFLKKAGARSGGIFVNAAPESIVPVRDREKVRIGHVEVQCLHTPGHTPGSQCFLAGKNLITGDTLFVDYCGRCDLPGGSPERLHESLSKKLAALDDEIVLYPGHNYSNRPAARLGDEKKTNPYLKAKTFQEFTRALQGLLD